jgi:hypothetical protein
MIVQDAVMRSGLSGRVKLEQAGQGSYSPLGFSGLKTFPDADVLYSVKATGTTVDDTVSLALSTGVMTAPDGAPTLKDSDGKDVNGNTIAVVTFYGWVKRKFRAGVLIEEESAMYPAGAVAAGTTVTAELTVIGDVVEIHVLGRSD